MLGNVGSILRRFLYLGEGVDFKKFLNIFKNLYNPVKKNEWLRKMGKEHKRTNHEKIYANSQQICGTLKNNLFFR